MRILVTGGAGFIGSHIVEACRDAGHDIFVVDDLSRGTRANLPEAVPLFATDICDKHRLSAIFESVKPHVVCHQAAQISVCRSVDYAADDAQINIVGLLDVCESAVRAGTRRIVVASSGGVLYGEVSNPATENTRLNPISPYGIAKWASEQYLQFFARQFGIEAVALRYANVYGPRQNPFGEAGVIAIFTNRLLRGEPVTIHGDGQYDRDYVYCEDVAHANLKAITRTLRSGFIALNIGTGIVTNVNAIAGMISEQVKDIARKVGCLDLQLKVQQGLVRAGDLRSSVLEFNARRRRSRLVADNSFGYRNTQDRRIFRYCGGTLKLITHCRSSRVRFVGAIVGSTAGQVRVIPD